MTDDDPVEQMILALLAQRSPSATICPSEVARLIAGDDFDPWMEPVRQAARRLVARGVLEITQAGRVVDLDTLRGPIRLRRRRQA